MKKLKTILSFIFTLGIICLGFSFAFNFDTKITASALSQTEIVENIMNGECVEKGGAIYLSAGSTYNMSGGEMSGHFAEKGGALYISDGAVFTMTGGTITGNYAKYGGAIYVASGGECYINGGTITGNFAENAPAIYVESGGILEISDNALVDGNEYINLTPTNINIYVDGTLSKTIEKVGESYTIDESEMPLDYEHCCGYFYDLGLSQCTNGVVDLTRGETTSTFAPKIATADPAGINIYTKTASNLSNFTFTLNDTTGTYDIKAKNTSISGHMILPKEYNNVQTSIYAGTKSSTGAFYNCTSMTGITFQEGLLSVSNYAFYNLSSLTCDLIIPDSVTSIGNGAFSYCSGLISVTIGDSVTSIGNYVFSGCSGLTSVIIPDSVTSIGDSAFSFCSGLTSVIIPNSVISLEGYVFWGCSGLTSVIIGNSVTSIGGSAFDSCSGLTSVIIGNSVTSIGDSAFSSCSRLTSVTIPDSVTSIGSSAFYNCSVLTSVYIPNSVTTISASSSSYTPFYKCSSSLVIYTEVVDASSKPSGWSTYWNYYGSSNQLQVVYGCSLDSEGNIVTPPTINFYVDGTYHSSITKEGTSYTVQESEMPLQYESCCGYFLDEGLTTTIKNNTIDLSNGDVNLYTRTATDSSYFTFEKNTTTGFYDIVGTTIESGDVVLPKEYQGVQVSIGITDVMYEPGINEPVFYDKNISSIILPSGLTELINYVFFDCSLIGGELIIPDSVTSIGNYAFQYCSGLTSVTIGNSVTSIGSSAFESCSGLTSVTIGNSVTSIGSYAFSSCSGLTEVKVSSGNTVYEDRGKNAIIEKSTNTIIYGFNCTDLSVLEEVTSIGSSAFESCSELTSVTIPNSVTSIGSAAFYYCSGLTSVTIGDGVTSIGSLAFSDCSGLTSLTIGDSVESIGSSAFSGCSGLTSLTIGDSVTSIGRGVFSYCYGLTSVTIPDSVTSIGYSAFSSCSGLTSVYIPSSVTTISASSWSTAPFYKCSSSLVIYTDVANASSKPSGWGTYWNYRSSNATYTTNYGYTLEQYKSAVGLTFAPNGEKVNGAEIEVVKEDKACQVDNSYLQEMLLDKREYIVLPKKQVKIA